jgi:hypothetical protein
MWPWLWQDGSYKFIESKEFILAEAESRPNGGEFNSKNSNNGKAVTLSKAKGLLLNVRDSSLVRLWRDIASRRAAQNDTSCQLNPFNPVVVFLVEL